MKSAKVALQEELVAKLVQWSSIFEGTADAQMVYLTSRAISQSATGPLQVWSLQQMVYPGVRASHEQTQTDLEKLLAGTDQDSLSRADTLLALAEILCLSDQPDDFQQAGQYLNEALTIISRTGDVHRTTEVQIVSAKVTLAQRDIGRAIQHLEQAARFVTTFPPTSAFTKTSLALKAYSQQPSLAATI